MRLPQTLTRWLKTLISDIRNSIVSLIVGALALAFGAAAWIFARNLVLSLFEWMQSPTPLWATILLVVLGLLLIYLKTQPKTLAQPPVEDKPIKEKTSELTPKDIDILHIIAGIKPPRNGRGRYSIPVASISGPAKLSEQQIRYHLDRLHVAKCLQFDYWGHLVGISPKGRALLFEKGLLS